MKPFFRLLLIAQAVVMLSLFCTGCVTTGPEGKKSFVALPTSVEISIGQGMAQQVAQTEKILGDTVWQNYLNEIGQKIVRKSDRQDITYSFTVIESDQVNAFAAPGGFIYFYTGLLREMKSEAELAAVLAHEISHVVGRHSAKQIQAMLGVQLAAALVFGGEGASEAMSAAINVGMSLAFSGYSREFEREADHSGIVYMHRAGYNPNGAIGMFETLARLGGERGGSGFEKLLASHPETQERIANAKNQIAQFGAISPTMLTGETRYQKMVARLPAKKK